MMRNTAASPSFEGATPLLLPTPGPTMMMMMMMPMPLLPAFFDPYSKMQKAMCPWRP